MAGPERAPASSLPPILIRADAAPQIGTGHVMRCLALAQAWQAAGGTARVASVSLNPALEARLRAGGIGVSYLGGETGSQQEADQTLALAREVGAGWLVVDGYRFLAEYQRAIARAGLPQLCVDDCGDAGHYSAGLVLNQNVHASDTLYGSREPATRLLLGTKYALLRTEFSPWRGWTREIPETARKVLVTLGGSDPSNATLKVIEALQHARLPSLEAKVVVGGSNPHIEAIRRVARAGSAPVEVVEDSAHMPDLMAWADLAVSAAGGTCWELAFMQLPALLLVLAENQRCSAECLARLGAAVSLGWHAGTTPQSLASALVRLLADGAVRGAMARKGAALVDGRGAERVAEILAREAVRLRPATIADRERLFGWANDPLTRRMSLHSQAIAWDEHLGWFERIVADPLVLLLVAEAWQAGAWVPAGQARLDADGTVSLGLAPGFRGRGLAGPVLRTAVAMARAREPGRPLVGYIKPENAPSQRVFAEAGFRNAGAAEMLNQPCLRYVYGEPALADAALGETEG